MFVTGSVVVGGGSGSGSVFSITGGFATIKTL